MKEIKREAVIKRYLLGELDDDDRQAVEQRVITDRDYKEEVLMVEEELVEDYVTGALEAHETDLFRKNYLSTPRQQQKLRVAQALDKYAAQRSPTTLSISKPGRFKRLLDRFRSQHLVMQLSWAVLALVVLGGAWLAFQTWRGSSQKSELQAELKRLNGPESTVLAASPAVFQVSLPPLNLRALNGAVNVTINKETQIVQLRIPSPPSHYATFHATLKDSSGEEVVTVNDLTVRDADNMKIVVLQLPVRIFRSDDYILTLSCVNSSGIPEETGDYAFRVLRQQNP